MIFAVAYIAEDFPRYDKMEVTPTTIKYSYKGVDFVEERKDNALIMRQQFLGLSFVNAANYEEAMRKTIEEFPRHIRMMTASPVPPP